MGLVFIADVIRLSIRKKLGKANRKTTANVIVLDGQLRVRVIVLDRKLYFLVTSPL